MEGRDGGREGGREGYPLSHAKNVDPTVVLLWCRLVALLGRDIGRR